MFRNAKKWLTNSGRQIWSLLHLGGFMFGRTYFTIAVICFTVFMLFLGILYFDQNHSQCIPWERLVFQHLKFVHNGRPPT